MATSLEATPLTKYPPGSLRELISIQFPLLLSLASGSLMGFCDRLFLARYSLESFEAVSYAIYICMIFQLGCMRVASASQVLVGRSVGAATPKKAGEYTWQMIWFSIASMALTLPLSFAIGSYFFSVGKVGTLGTTYFYWMMGFNFLFPMGTSLTGFFTGIGKTRIITYATLISHSFNILLNYPLIFGIPGLIPSLGISGAAIATGTAQGIYCLLLLSLFIKEKYQIYGCRKIRLQLHPLLAIFRLGLPSASARMHNLFVWSLMMKIIAEQGDNYILALSFGSMLSFLFSPLNESSTLALLTLFSYYFGSAKEKVSLTILKKAHLLGVINFCVVSFILILFREPLIHFFIKKELSQEALKILQSNTLGFCLFFAVESLMWISFSWVMSMKKAVHVMVSGIFCCWFFGYGGFVLIFSVLKCPAYYVWYTVGIHLLAFTIFYYVGGLLKQKAAPLKKDAAIHI